MNAPRPVKRRARRQWTAFGILFAISVVLMGTSGTSAASDVESGFNYAMQPPVIWLNQTADTLGSYWSAFTQIDRLRTENDQLRQENEKLQEELARMPAISQLNIDWTKISEAQQSLAYASTPARVIIRDLSGVRARTFILDKGSDDGVEVNQVVITAGGALVGMVQSVGGTVSQVLLLNDPASVVVGKEVQSSAIGTIRGQVGGILLMADVDASQTLDKGAEVVTAGESIPGTDARSPYPPALLIGQIESVSNDPNAVVKSCYISPAADFANINYVLVITGYKGGIPLGTPAARGSQAPGSSASQSPTSSQTSKPGPPASPSASR
jgi:rod shape-determining protein MreC